MSEVPKWNLVSVEDYLAGELISPVKREYLAGVVYAMAGTRNAHSLISANLIASVGMRLLGKPCRPFASDTKIRIRLPHEVRFYYPDVPVICRPNPQRDSFQDNPAVIFEVLSKATRRVDEGEKKDAYLSLPSLFVYALVEQETATIVVFRRTPETFVREVYHGLGAVLPLKEIDIELPLAVVYDAVEFGPEPDYDEP